MHKFTLAATGLTDGAFALCLQLSGPGLEGETRAAQLVSRNTAVLCLALRLIRGTTIRALLPRPVLVEFWKGKSQRGLLTVI